MKRYVFTTAILLLFIPFSKAQVIQKIHCSAITVCTLGTSSTPVTAGDLMIVAARTTQPFIDTSGAVWKGISFQGWDGQYDTLFYASAVITSPVTLQFSSAISDVSMLEYPPAVFDQRSSTAYLCCQPSATVGPLITAGASELLVLIINPLTTGNFNVPNFTSEDFSAGVVVEDEEVTPGTYSAIVPQGSPWGAVLFAFTSVNPPPPPVTLTVNPGSTAVYDNGTAILPGTTVIISQKQNSTNTVQIGSIVSDANGNLSGTLTVNPNWADSNGNLWFYFGLSIIPNMITYPVPVGEFQHGSTGLTVNLVLFSAGALGVHSQTLAVTP